MTFEFSLEENSEEISSVALLNPACFQIYCGMLLFEFSYLRLTALLRLFQNFVDLVRFCQPPNKFLISLKYKDKNRKFSWSIQCNFPEFYFLFSITVLEEKRENEEFHWFICLEPNGSSRKSMPDLFSK